MNNFQDLYITCIVTFLNQILKLAFVLSLLFSVTTSLGVITVKVIKLINVFNMYEAVQKIF